MSIDQKALETLIAKDESYTTLSSRLFARGPRP
jgi:hypothetical protein